MDCFQKTHNVYAGPGVEKCTDVGKWLRLSQIHIPLMYATVSGYG